MFCHQINELKGSMSIAILFKSYNSTLMSPIVTSLAKTKDSNTFSSTIVDATNVIDVEFGVKA
jgi:hypothetical protein